MKKSYWLFIICLITAVVISSIVIILNKSKLRENIESDVNAIRNTENSISDSTNKQKIENIIQDLGYNNTNSEIYKVKTEYDGREVISVKPNVQYKVAMAGILKNQKPDFSEIDNLLKQAPNKSGIWIEENSRERFLNTLNSITSLRYTIDNEGYLKQEQSDNFGKIDKVIESIMDNKKVYSISINSSTYLVDEVTGNIEEYPFEDIDPKQPYELFETENAALYIINSNSKNKLSDKEIIEEVLNNMNY